MLQHQLATAEHYDFRLEIDGALVSWAVPKRPAADTRRRPTSTQPESVLTGRTLEEIFEQEAGG